MSRVQMGSLVRVGFIALALSGASGCAMVTSSMPTMTNATGEAWYTQGTGFIGMTWNPKVFFCPSPSSPGPVTCKEAKMVELTKAELEAQKQK